ncbi:MAG: hypothetical protein V3V67_08095 [Myxococcota bacterium]
MSAPADSLRVLPGADLVLRGLEDLARARATPEAALIEVASTRLRSLGVPVPVAPSARSAAELRLYDRLGTRHPDRDPYGLYCAWLDQLASFVVALTQLRERSPHGAVDL